ncbi:uncharacterized protein (DUF342 family) [Oikeobacillus pervagus]|uniref:Uncharacterized protein (DUF342 family) n=1 Tax=Oikeobacillus pervagus TaxID=1325931 RepID=A0AAJ1T156_9BACI|nr:FapA family protein [Oikeobacillus pervagus]MDQ0214044.1 uncharacterized protein (DUF342 family) [Oikeobacillus pervagus]
MDNAVIIKGQTIEEAIEKALTQLHASRDQVEIEVLRKNSSTLFGLHQKKAIVQVTKKGKTMDQEHSSYIKTDRETNNENILEESNQPLGKAWIKNGKIYFSCDENHSPSIIPNEKLTIFVNGQKITEKTEITSQDRIEIQLTENKMASEFHIQLVENNMKVLLKVKPGKKIIYLPKDSEARSPLTIDVEEKLLSLNDLTVSMILNELNKQNIVEGIDENAILQAIKQGEEGEWVIATGTPVQQGTDGKIDFLVSYETTNISPRMTEKGSVDFREVKRIPHVEERQWIATIQPSVAGSPGKNVKGEILKPKPVHEFSILPGKGITVKGDRVYSTVNGKPHIDRRGNIVKIEVNDEFFHQGNVDLSSGNIRFQGNLNIAGNIEESMEVEAKGEILVHGTVSNAIASAGKSFTIVKNVFSSDISAGASNAIVADFTDQLNEIRNDLKEILQSVKAILKQMTTEQRKKLRDPQLINVLIEKKYPTFPLRVKLFVQKITKKQSHLSEEWIGLGNHLYRIVMNSIHQPDVRVYEQLLKEIDQMYEFYAVQRDEATVLTVPYAINSQLYSSGDVQVTGQGLYNSVVKAKGKVKVAGFIKGGEVTAGKLVEAEEAGSEFGVHTEIKVDEDGMISMKTVYADTMIQIGKRRHHFDRTCHYVKARISDEGDIIF